MTRFTSAGGRRLPERRPGDTKTRRALGRLPVVSSLLLVAAAFLLFSSTASAHTSTTDPLSGANAHVNGACTYRDNGAIYTDRTSAANDVVVSDVILGDTVLNTGTNAVFFGMNEVFKTIYVDVGTAASNGPTVSWYYWNGSAWAALTVTDNTNHFRTSGVNTVTFDPPSAWAETEVNAANCAGTRYYVKAEPSGVYTTAPAADQVSAIEYNYRITAQDEASYAKTGLSQGAFSVADGTTTTIFAWRDTGSAVYELALFTEALDHTMTVSVAVDGYVTYTQSTHFSTTAATLTTSLKFALKVIVDDELSGRTTITGATVTTGNTFGTACVEKATPDGNYYCAVPLADTGTDVKVAKDGYVTKTLAGGWKDRTAAADAQAEAPDRVRTQSGALSSGRAYTAAVSDGTDVYVFGGKTVQTPSTRTDEIVKYSVGGDSMTTKTAVLPAARSYVSGVWNGNYIYLFGGLDTVSSDDIMKYDIANDQLTVLTEALPQTLDGTSAVWTGSKVYIFGGTTTTVQSVVRTDDIVEYNPSNGAVTTKTAALPTARADTSAIWTGTYAYIFGGYDGAAKNQILKYDPAADTLTTMTTTLPAARYWTSAVWDGTYAYVFGGEPNTNQIVRYDPATDTVTTMATPYPTDRLPKSLEGTSAAYVGSKAYIFGGYDGSFQTGTYKYDTARNLDLSYSYKVTGVSNELGTSLTTVTVSAGNSQGTSCTESTGAWYCAVPLTDTTLTIQAAKDGYVTDTGSSFGSDRTDATQAQVTGTVSNVKFTVKITVATETSLSGVTWEKKVGGGSYAAVTPDATSSNIAYFAQSPSEASVVFKAAKNGVSSDTGTAFTASATAQTTKTLSLVAALASLTTSAAALGAGSQTTYTFGFTNGHAWPKGGKLVITFPSGYTVGSPSVTLTGADNTATASVSGLTVTVTRSGSGTDTAASTSITVALTQITNPTTAGATGTFSLSLQDAAATTLDTGTSPAVTIAAGALATITVSPSSATVAVDASQTFTASGADANGNSVSITPTWSANCGSITSAGVFTAPTTTGSCTVTATSGSVSGTAAVTVSAGALATITVTPANPEIVKSASQTFTAAGADSYGNSVTISPTWSASCGSITSGGVYTAPATTGTCTVTATSGSVSGSTTATIVGGIATQIASSGGSSFTGVTAGGTQTLRALVRDAGSAAVEGIAVTWAVTAGGGSLSATTSTTGSDGIASITLTTGTTVGTNNATATKSGLTGSPVTFTVTTVAGPLASISVSPSGPTVAAGASQTFTASGADQYGNSVTVTATWSAACGSITSGGVYTAPATTGSCTVTATSGSISGTATATISAGALTALTTTAANRTASVETTYTFAFTPANPWPAGGKLVVAFPEGYALGSSPAITLTGADSTATASVSDRTLTATRSGTGTATAAGTAVTVAVTQITNPTADGTTGTFTLTTKTSGGDSIDTAASPAVSIVTNALSVTGLSSSTHPGGVWKPSASLSTSWSAPQDATVVGYSWGLDAAPDDVVDGSGLGATVSGLAEGTHSFKIKAKNAAGTWGPVASYGNIYVDTVPPKAPSITSGTFAAGLCSGATAGSFQWSSSDATSGLHATQPYAYALDGAAPARGSATTTSAAGLADGSHFLTATAYDAADGAATATFSFKVDTLPPSLTLSAPAYTNAPSVTLAWSAADGCTTVASVTLEYRPTGGAWQSVATSGASGSVAVNGLTADGAYEFHGRASDALGHATEFPASPQATTILDRVAPGAPTNVRAVPEAQGSARVTWSAASDDRSGVDGYNVYRVGPDGAPRQANAGLVRATEFVDAGQPDGSTFYYVVKAVDRAVNEGTGASSLSVVLDGQAPEGVPGRLTAVGLSAGVLASTPVQLTWEGVDGAHSYQVYAGSTPGFALVPAARLGVASSTSFQVSDARDGPHSYAVTARDAVGNEGPAARLSLVVDTQAPASKATAPAESGPAVLVSWTSQDAGVGVATVQLWVLEEGREPTMFYQSMRAEGAVSFYGVQGHTYRFLSIAKDSVARVEPKALDPAAADATTRITSSVVSAGAGAVKTLDRLLGSLPGTDPTGALQTRTFYAEDRDQDGFPESFVDPNAALVSLRVLRLESGQDAFLLGRPSPASLPLDPVALWNPASDAVDEIVLTNPIQAPQLTKAAHGRTELTVNVDKSGWILIVVDDAAPHRPIEGVLRGDGSRLPETFVWREGSQMFIVDDPSTEYTVIYARAPVPFWMSPAAGLALVGLAVGGLLVWIVGPSLRTLERAARGRSGIAWALRHCVACERALPRHHRLVRGLHACPSFALRLEAKALWWQTAPFQERLRETRALAQAVPWLSDLNALGRLTAGGWEETLVPAPDEEAAAPGRLVPGGWEQTLVAAPEEGSAAAPARPRVLSERVRGPRRARWEETLWADDEDARLKKWLPASLW